MRRLRLALVLLLIALAVPVGLLLARALRSVAVEERVRHEAVAERIFDEMERALSDFLAREEARAPDEYDFYLGTGAVERAATARMRSPLSHPAAEPFVVAHFQIDPDGRLQTPLRPRDVSAAERAGDWPPAAAERAPVEEAIHVLEREVAPFWRDAEAQHRALAKAHPPAAPHPPPPPTIAESVPAADAFARAPEAPLADAVADDGQASAYEVLQSLNTGARKRAARREQVAEVDPERSLAGRILGDSLRSAEASPAEPKRERADAPTRTPAAASVRQTVGRSADAASPPMRARRAPVRVVLEPMAGLPIGDSHWMLYRTVLDGGGGYRQGLLLDRAALGAWLREQVIGDGPLAEVASVRFGAGAPPGPAGAHVSAHRFAEPFSGLDAVLRVGPLQQTGSAATLVLLAAALAFVAVIGVLAVHRMAAVVVEFAERRSNFVAAVSHELKTPLTAIRMYAEMLRDGIVPDDAHRDTYYRTITDESERLSRLIDNVLEFSRLEKGGRLLATSVGSPAPVLRDIVERLRPHAEREGFALRLEIGEPIAPVRFDRDALAQMVFNLVDNAIKYAARSERKEIVLSCDTTDDGQVAIAVRDYGPGVPREHLTRVFEPFFRVEAELTRSTRGSGIGLSLVKQLGDAMGAAVSGETPAGGGFRVRIALPAATA